MRTDLLRVSLSIGLLGATVAVACSNSSSGGPATTTLDSGTSIDTGTGTTPGDTGAAASTEASVDGGCLSVKLTPTSTGYVAVTDIGLVGSWFSYGDGQGSTGSPPGDCEKAMNPAAACSSITFPSGPEAGAVASFPPYMGGPLGTMCLVGNGAQVVGTPPDYADIFGIGIGLDFNNPGGDSGGPQPYNATLNHITGLTFTVAGLPTAANTRLNIEFQEPATDVSPNDAWAYQITADGPTTVLLQSGLGAGQLQPAFAAVYPAGQSQPPFDPTMIEGIQFHIVTNTTNAIPVTGLCISDLAATYCP